MKKIGLLLSVLLLFAIGISAQETGSSTAAASTAKTSKSKPRGPVFRPTAAQVKSGQQVLIDAKLLVGEATGKYTNETREAIRSYQKANGLDVNGKFDKATLEKMNIPLTDHQLGKATEKRRRTQPHLMMATSGRLLSAQTPIRSKPHRNSCKTRSSSPARSTASSAMPFARRSVNIKRRTASANQKR